VGHPDAKLILFETCALAKNLEKGTESVKAWGESLDFCHGMARCIFQMQIQMAGGLKPFLV
jgi:hypothetical protein